MSAPAEDAACHFGNWLLPTNVGFRAMTLDGGTTAMSSDAVFGLKATELRVEPRYRLTLLRYRQTLPLAGCGYRQCLKLLLVKWVYRVRASFLQPLLDGESPKIDGITSGITTF